MDQASIETVRSTTVVNRDQPTDTILQGHRQQIESVEAVSNECDRDLLGGCRRSHTEKKPVLSEMVSEPF